MTDVSDLIGIVGALVTVYCYARVQWHRDYAKEMSYSIGNLVGTVFMLFSLMYHWNISAFLTNVVWGFISLYGIFRCMSYRWRKDA